MYDRFKELGVPVYLTRDGDTTLSPTERVNIANGIGNTAGDILIANHINSGGGDWLLQ